MKRRKAEPITSVVLRYLAQNSLLSPLNEYRLVASWPEVAGKRIASLTRDIYIRSGVLNVRLKSPAMRSDLMMRRAEFVKALNEKTMDTRVSSRLPFGIPSNFSEYSETLNSDNSVILYRSERSKSASKKVYINPKYISKNIEWKDRIKVLVSKASPGGDDYPHAIISAPVLAGSNSVCTETYLIVDFVDTEESGNNLISYMNTKFFRFMMSLIKNTQNISKSVFSYVPVQDWSKPWTDEELYTKYHITADEIEFIDSMIRPMGGE